MNQFEVLLAKSWQAESPGQETPDYAKLVAHLQAVELAGASIIEVIGELILRQLDLLADEWLSRLSRALRVACLCHDLGKANEGFQEMVTGQRDPKQQPARHELLSALLLEDKTSPFRAWALEMLKEDDESEARRAELHRAIHAVNRKRTIGVELLEALIGQRLRRFEQRAGIFEFGDDAGLDHLAAGGIDRMGDIRVQFGAAFVIAERAVFFQPRPALIAVGGP